MKLKAGKLPHDLLAELLMKVPPSIHNVSLPPQIGGDAGVFITEKNTLAVTTDPITFTTDRIGYYSICVNMNDIVCQGAIPKWYTASLLLPVDFDSTELIRLWDDLCHACQTFQVDLVSGHTEVTPAVNQPIIVGQLIGETSRVLSPKDIQPGDALLMYGSAGLEGASIISDKTALKNLAENPGICIAPFAIDLFHQHEIVALHDPTEGGIATAIHELADAAGVGVDVNQSKIMVLPDIQACCDAFNINPLGLLASGSLLIVCKQRQLEKILLSYPNQLKHIGYFTENPRKRTLSGKPLPRFDHDEITRCL